MKKMRIARFLCILLTVVLGGLSNACLIVGAASINTAHSVLYGRSALFIGDSITQGTRDSATYKSWAGRVGQKNGMNYINAGRGGTSISTCRATKQGRIIDQLNTHAGKSFDYVIMHGGVNDAWDKASVGVVTEGFDSAAFDETSFAGGLEQTFARAKELFPDAVHGFIMNNALPKCPYGYISNMSDYMTVAKEVCQKWGVAYLDLYNNTEFCYNVLKVDTLEYFGDDYYCHPNAAGYDLIAPLVERWMENLPHPDNPTMGDQSGNEANGAFVNIFNASTAENGFYHPTTNAKNEASTYSTNIVEVKKGDVITFGPVPRSGQDFFLIGYNVSGDIVSTDFQNREILTVTDDTFRNHYLYSYTVPENVVQLRFTVPTDLKPIFTATKNELFDAFDFYAYWNGDATRAAIYLKSQRSNALLDGYSGQPFEVDEDSILKGRSVLFLGDSIVSSERDTSLFYRGWADRIGIVNGMDYLNNGKSGSSFSTKKQNRIITYLMSAERTSYDYIITNGGVNDAWVKAPVGKMSDSYRVEDFDITTFAGALEEFFFYAKEIFPDSMIGYICTFSMPSATNYGYVSNMDAYYAVAKQICEKWGVYCLDLYNNAEFCKNVLQTDSTIYLSDHVHPNGAGVDLVYPIIEDWMKSLPHPDNPKDDYAYIPDGYFDKEPTTDTTESTGDEIAETNEDTASNSTPFFDGCSSGISSSVIPLVAVASAGASALMIKKKKHGDDETQ